MSNAISPDSSIREIPESIFKPWKRMSTLPAILQSENTECGLACLAMISSYFGAKFDIASLRATLGPAAQDGMTLKQLMSSASRIALVTRPVRTELESLKRLKTPCILHWDHDHFVVLKSAGKHSIVIHDPKVGARKMTYAAASEHLTGYAIEFHPDGHFERSDNRVHLSFRSIIGRTQGLRSALANVFFMALLLQIISMVSPALMQHLVDSQVDAKNMSVVKTVVAAMAILMIISVTISTLRSWMLFHLATNVGFQWTSRVLRHLFRLPVDYFEKRNIGDVMSRFGSISAIQGTLTNGVIEGILDGILAVGTLIMVWLYSPVLAMTCVAALVLIAAIKFASFESLRRLGNEILIADARVSTNFLESVRGIRSIKLANRDDHRSVSWMNLTVDAINVKSRSQWLSILLGTAGTLIVGTQKLIAIYFAFAMIAEGNFTLGMFFAYLSYQDQFMSRANNLIGLYFSFRMLQLHYERLADIVLAAPESSSVSNGMDTSISSQNASEVGISTMDGPPSIVFEKVSFKYSDLAKDTIHDLSFDTTGSACTVIVGPSGSGKTTVAKLILGIHKPCSGRIQVHGHSLESIDRSVLREHIACVLQGDTLYAGSIRDNIAFFDDNIDQQWVEECARIACVDGDIERTNMRYHTPVGDMGSILSAGQKQRILIARALYRRPRILLLDEATSDLDVATEERINQNLSRLPIHRIYIAHRPQTIKYGDRIVDMKVDGRSSS
jgi:ATP-binding cassette, subfamily B, bacterial CvaB/MchF/RaxB